MNQNFGQYKNVQINTASKGQLLLMTYDGAIRFLNTAICALESDPKDLPTANNYIIKTQDIIHELIATLNMEAGGEVAQNLLSLYIFFKKHLIEANIRKETSGLKVVKHMMGELRNAWNSAVNNVEKKTSPAPVKAAYGSFTPGSLNLKG